MVSVRVVVGVLHHAYLQVRVTVCVRVEARVSSAIEQDLGHSQG